MFFMSRIVYKKQDANHKLIFIKFEKELKVCIKIFIHMKTPLPSQTLTEGMSQVSSLEHESGELTGA